MTASFARRFACLLLTLALVLPLASSALAASSGNGLFGRSMAKAGRLHRPVYKKYQPGCRWIFQK
ncbi:hypothetical protein F0P96_03145 [Hymenobacter busanensis]|uniref:Uncharacterized protein n=1 Tax=Hymenobacter busanensis TaxID=2607656 RepID=A0A7L4ZYT5_9BACT|nr:hypothetical protein [Hymenobacter busanensis]KAA9339624.1 hypothetical protein F0P96_03145 [Hymenobacter busanensis]QHJ06620.1 hypothetical protein GUY19_04605 [Hymenobacter busanensis]